MKNLLTAIIIFASASISFGQTRSVLMNTSNIVVQPTNAIYYQGDVNAPNFYSPGVIEGDQILSTGFMRVSEAAVANPTTLSLARGIRFPDLTQTSVFYSFNDSGHKVAWAWGTNATNISDRIIFRPDSFQVNGEIKFGTAANAGATRTNLALGATNDVNFASLTLAGPLNFGNDNKTGANGSLRTATTNGQTIEFVTTGSVRAILGPIDFVLSQPNGALAFAPTNTTGAAITRTNLQLASYVTNPIVPLANGGTGATNAGTAITNLGATAVGSALFTTANEAAARTTLQLAAYVTNPIVPLTNGGTGASVAGQARTNLGATAVGDAVFVAVDAAAARSAIGAIASTNNITGTASNVTGVVAITNGGTGANTASGARTNLEIGGGLNSTITFLAGTQTNTVTITNGIITSWTQSP